MGNRIVVHKENLKIALEESRKHLERVQIAVSELERFDLLPLDLGSLREIEKNNQLMAFTDQLIYRFSKLQDAMGAKLFKALLLYKGENTEAPFLDILNRLEKINVLNVEEWFEYRDLRNEISHNYDNKEITVIAVINAIYRSRERLNTILANIEGMI